MNRDYTMAALKVENDEESLELPTVPAAVASSSNTPLTVACEGTSNLPNSTSSSGNRTEHVGVSSRAQSPCSSFGDEISPISDDRLGSDAMDNDGVPLPEGFTPGDDDVICGRGKKCYSHIGNKRFRQRVMLHLEDYCNAKTKLDKSSVLSRVVEEVRRHSPGGGFVKQDTVTGRWFEVGDFLAREKTSQAFRDCDPERYKSSNLSKKKKRQDEQAKASITYNRLARSEYTLSRIERLSREFLRHQPDNFSANGAQGNSYNEVTARLLRLSANTDPYPFRRMDRNLETHTSPAFRPIEAVQGRSPVLRKAEHYLSSSSRQQLRQQTFQDTLFGDSMRNLTNTIPQDFSMTPHIRNSPVNDGLRGLGRITTGQRSDPGLRTDSLSETSLTVDEGRAGRLFRSLPDIGLQDSSNHSMFDSDPFMDREQFEKLCNSIGQPGPPRYHERNTLTNLRVPRSTNELAVPSTFHHQAHHQMISSSAPLRHNKVDTNIAFQIGEKIPVNLSASMHSDIVIGNLNQDDQSEKKKPVSTSRDMVEYDPIPLDQQKSLALEKRKSAFYAKLNSFGESRSSRHSASLPSDSGRFSKDLLECLSKMTDHSIADDPFEPIPMSPQEQRLLALQQQHLANVEKAQILQQRNHLAGLLPSLNVDDDMDDVEFHDDIV